MESRTLYLFIKDAAYNIQSTTATYTPYKECSTTTSSTSSWGPRSEDCGGGEKIEL